MGTLSAEVGGVCTCVGLRRKESSLLMYIQALRSGPLAMN